MVASNDDDTSRPTTVDVRVGEQTLALRTKPAFDDFWRFTAARHDVFMKRAAGQPPPWTQDVALATHGYCNVYRVLDRCSQYLIRNVIQQGPQDIEEVVFRVCLYNVFHRVETWELLCRAFPPTPTYAAFDEQAYIDVLSAAKQSGAKLYTGAFQKPAHRWTPVTHANHMWLIAAFMGAGLPGLLARCATLADVYAELKSFPGMGPFNAWQLALDLSYTPAFHFHPADLVVPGPGALAGLNLCFHLPKSARKAVDPRALDGAMRHMAATQAEHFARLNLSFAGLGPDHLPLQPLDIEHTLCEFTKYTRERGTRGAFTPRAAAAVPSQVLPVAWAHRARRTERVCAVPRDLPKRYVVERVVARDAGRRLLLVRWLGYGPADDTWEDEDTLAEDAPDAVAAFRKPAAKRKGAPGANAQSHSAGSTSHSSPTAVSESMAPRKSASAAVTDADADGEPTTPPPAVEEDAAAPAPALEPPSTPKGKAPKAGKAVRSSPRKLPESGAVKTAYGKRKRPAAGDDGAPAPKRKRASGTRKPRAKASEEERYEIESIVDRRGDGRAVQYRVHWKGYPASQRTWEPAAVLKQDAPAAVADFEKARVKKAVVRKAAPKARAPAKPKARTTAAKPRARTTTTATKRRRSGARK